MPTWASDPTVAAMGHLSWTTIVILLSAMIVPSTPGKMLATALAAASLGPLGVWLAYLRGVDVPSVANTMRMYMPSYSCAIAAVIPSHMFQQMAALTSPHTIRPFDYGATDDGRFYYVMELLDGRDMAALVGEFGPLPVPRVFHLLRQVCHSLAEAHGRGLVHRDIKPANNFVCRMGRDADVVKVLDFPSARPPSWLPR